MPRLIRTNGAAIRCAVANKASIDTLLKVDCLHNSSALDEPISYLPETELPASRLLGNSSWLV